MTYGRPRTLDDVRRGEICALVSTGLTIQEAARYVRCSAKTIQREASRNDDFRRALHNAELSARLEPLKLVRQAAGAHWRAAAWLLERTDPERFAHRPAGAVRPVQVEEACHRVVEAALKEIADPEGRRRAQRRLRSAVDNAVRDLFTPARGCKRASRPPAEAPPLVSQEQFSLELEQMDQFFWDRRPDVARRTRLEASPGVQAESAVDNTRRHLVRALAQKISEKLANEASQTGQKSALLSPKTSSAESGTEVREG